MRRPRLGGHLESGRGVVRPLAGRARGAGSAVLGSLRWSLAAKAALAATLAWLVVQPLGGVADDVPYYAPLGAVVVVTTSVAGAVRAGVQAVVAIAGGAALAVGAEATSFPGAVEIALVVGLGSVIGSWTLLGAMGSWVPISALFVLIIGRPDTGAYVLGYLGLTSVGALVGAVVSAVMPALPTRFLESSRSGVRSVLADQLESLADGLEQPGPVTAEQWSDRRWDMGPSATRLQRSVDEMRDARKVNWRVRRAPALVVEKDLHALDGLAATVRQLTELLVGREEAASQNVALGPDLRPEVAASLRTVATAVRSVVRGEIDVVPLDAAVTAVRELGETVRQHRGANDGEFFAAGAVVVWLRRAVELLHPADLPSRALWTTST